MRILNVFHGVFFGLGFYWSPLQQQLTSPPHLPKKAFTGTVTPEVRGGFHWDETLALPAFPASLACSGPRGSPRLEASPWHWGSPEPELCEHLKMQCPGLLCARSVTACQTAAFSFRHPQGQTPAFILCYTIFLSSEVTISGRLPEYFHVGVIKDTLCRTVPAVCSCFEQERWRWCWKRQHSGM